MTVKFIAMDSETARHLQNGGKDAYGNLPINRVSDGGAIPCRHCLKPVAAGDAYLTLAFSPFGERQPYAETGPIFLHAEPCERAADTSEPAPMFSFNNSEYILRGYDGNDWIHYEVADVVPASELAAAAEAMLAREDVAYLHMRSSRFNCYQCRIERAD